MGQVLINLLANAIKFTPDGGKVWLRFHPMFQNDAERVHFTVQDTGMGVPSDKLSIIFEPFRQVDGSHTRSHRGTGLGLAITTQIVELHGGVVWADPLQ